METLLGPFIKYGVAALAVLAVLFGVYELGSSHGHTAGYKEAWDTQQKTINDMVTRQNAENQAFNDKITALEKASTAAANTIDDLQKQVQAKRTEVITKYVQMNPETSKTCGIDTSMAQTINAIIGADPLSDLIQKKDKQ